MDQQQNNESHSFIQNQQNAVQKMGQCLIAQIPEIVQQHFNQFGPKPEQGEYLPAEQHENSIPICGITVDRNKPADVGLFNIPIPYYARSSTLPARLPTRDEIQCASELSPERFGTKVVAVTPHYVIKYGDGVDLGEGRMMMFVQNFTKIPLPRVYALYQEDTTKYIVMEYINGQTLQTLWPGLSEQKKTAISHQIKHYLQELRAIQSPNAYCSLDNQPLRSELFWAGMEGVFKGPFKTESDLNYSLVQKYKATEVLKGKADFYKKCLNSIFRNHPPVLTHGDLQLKNIMIQADNRIVILDWYYAGWYPSYWEYTSAIVACTMFRDDWHHWVDKILEQFRTEYFVFITLQNEIGW